MPRPVNAAIKNTEAEAEKPTPDPLDEVALSDSIIRPESPIITCKVVYIGPNRNKSVALKGRLSIEKFENGPGEEPTITKRAITEGIQSYDFSTNDSRGKLITERLMPDTAAPHLRGKPFTIVEHTDHIRAFYEMRDAEGQREFEVMASRADSVLLQDYIRRSLRGRRQQEALFEEVSSSR